MNKQHREDVLAVDHVYLGYPNPFNGGADTYPVHAMGDSEIVMVLREFPAAIPDPDQRRRT